MHGVASGDPLQDRVILWTRVTPLDATVDEVRIGWEVSPNADFTRLVTSGSALTHRSDDFTIKVDATGLKPNTRYYYRFSTANDQSVVGVTKTLPSGHVKKVKLLAMSCANFQAGFFHVYAEAAKAEEVDAAVHLGDYIYEHARGGYASEDAERLGRLFVPEGELLTLADYRARYAQCRGDADLQNFHAALPVIAVWDDHEIANNTWSGGAQNHDDETEGHFAERLLAAVKAYSEWMPIRPAVDSDIASLARSFQFGDLVRLVMLDTRIVGKERALEYVNYMDDQGGFDSDRFRAEVNDPARSLLGDAQREWLKKEMLQDARWHVLGQQVLMGQMTLPGAIAMRQLSVAGFSRLVSIATLLEAHPENVTEEQQLFFEQKGYLLQLPNLPYNLDAWDGYPEERAKLLAFAKEKGVNLVVLAGDTHNAWAGNLIAGDGVAGVEFATASVTSPGVEAAFGLDTPEKIRQTEAGLMQLIEQVKYTNIADRGFLSLTFSLEAVTADWTFVSSIKEKTYTVLSERNKRLTVSPANVSL